MKLNKTFIILLSAILIEMIGAGIIIPLLPFLFTDPSSPVFMLGDISNVQRYGYILFGCLAAAYPLAQFVATPLLGTYSDKHGRKPLLLASIGGSVLSRITTGLAIIIGNIPLLFASRIFDGLTGGNISIAQASIADISDDSNRSKRFAYVGAMIGLGFIIGPFLGGLLSSIQSDFFGPALPFYIASLLSSISFLLNALMLPETNPLHNRSTSEKMSAFSSIKRAFSSVQLQYVLITGLLFAAGFSFYTSFFNVFMIEQFSFNEQQIGYFFAYIGIIIFLSQGFVVQKVSPRFGPRAILKYSLFACGIGMFLTYFSPSWQIVAVATLIFGISNAMSSVELSSLASSQSTSLGQGVGMGAYSSMSSLGQAVPPLIAGFLAHSITPSIPILVGAILCICAGIWFNYNSKTLVS